MHHRFLEAFDRILRSGGKRIWTLDGQTEDIFYFDAWFGILNLRHSLEAWGRRNRFQAIAVLNGAGVIDCSGSEDPELALRIFNGAAARPPKYGHAFTPDGQSGGDTAAHPDAPGEAAAFPGVSDATRLRNIFDKITPFVTRRRPDGEKVLLLVEDVNYQLGHSGGDEAVRNELRHTILTDWCVNVSSSALIVFYSSTAWQQEQSELFDDRHGTARNGTLTIGAPEAPEIASSLLRLGAREDFLLYDLTEISNWLAGQNGDLRSALARVVSVAARLRDASAGREAPMLRICDFIHLPEIDRAALALVQRKIDALVGLADVKQSLQRIAQSVERNRELIARGLTPPDETRHMLFLGNPGTGKSEVARLVEPYLHALGALPGGKFIETNLAQLRSEFTGETGSRFRKLIEDARGGVLFFDEIHQLGEAADSGPAREIKDVLVGALENYRHELVFIGAGYTSRMAAFWRLDPGLESRFPQQYRFEFKDYSVNELWEIFRRKIAPLSCDDAVERRIRAILSARSRRPDSGNARAVRMLVEAIRNGLSADATAIPESALPPLLDRHPDDLAQAQRELDALIGLRAPRRLIQSVMDNLEYDMEYNADADGTVRTHPGNMLFVGPPGTGKTTMAQLMAHYLYGLGVTERRDALVVTAKDMIGEYLGQTAPKVGDIFSRAQGGILFIDEAYALADNQEFGRQAITALVGEITLPANASVIVILAGYARDMERVFALNEGLRRRISHTVEFENFTPEDCATLAERLIAARHYQHDDEFPAAFARLAAAAIRDLGDGFGNAGWCVDRLDHALSAMKARVIRARRTGATIDPRKLLSGDLDENPQQES